MGLIKASARKLSSTSRITRTFLEQSSFLRRFLGRYLSREQDVDDVLQQAYLNVFNVEKNGGQIDRPKALLFNVAKNLALNELNRKSRKITDYIEECMPLCELSQQDTATVELEVEAQQTLGIYCEAIAKLPPKCRQVYLLRKVHGFSHKDIALRMGITLSAVEKHLHTGISRCRKYMEKHGASSTIDLSKHMLKRTKLKGGKHE